MAIRWKCPQCSRSLSVSDQKAGQTARCPACGKDLTVPQSVASVKNAVSVAAPAEAIAQPRGSSGMRAAIVVGFLAFLVTGVGLAWLVLFKSGQPAAHLEASGNNAALSPSGQVSQQTETHGTPIQLPQSTEPASDPGTDAKTPPTPLIPHRDPPTPHGPHTLHVAAKGNVILVTDRLNGSEIWRQSAGAPVVFLAFSVDGRSVISRDQKGELCTWDAATGKLEKREEAPTAVADKTPPKAEEPVTRAETPLDPEELRASLLKVKELDFYPVVDKLRDQAINASLPGTDFASDQQMRLQFAIMSPPKFLAGVNGVLLKKAMEEGLPLVPKEYSTLPVQAARTMDAMSKELRSRGFVSIPGGTIGTVSVVDPRTRKPGLLAQQQTSAHAKVLEDWCKENHIERYAGALNTFLQMLQVEDEPTRAVLVEELAKVDNPVAIRVLAQRAVFDLSPELRKATLEFLRKRKPETYRAVFLNTLRYPWAPAADHAAEALATLQDKGAIPELVGLLDKPDPSLPTYDEKRKTGMIQEVVRINHMRNCFVCHAVSQNPKDLVRGAVPRPGQPLPQMYYNAARADFVQASVTFLRQDFSVSQPVDNASPWPTMQRYDYMVRLRKATDAELAQLQDSPAPTYPQRNAVLAALRQLSGRDLGSATEPWQKYAAQLAPKKPATDKTETPKDNPDLKPAEKEKPAERKPADKAADLAPRPMTTATSPDGKLIAMADDKVVNIVDAQTMKQVARITGSTARITAVAFSPDGSLIASGGADKAVRICEAATGKQLCVCRSTVGISAISFSANGTTVTAVGIDQSTMSWDVDTGKQIAR